MLPIAVRSRRASRGNQMEPEPTYTVFIRVPFPRGNFVDPPLVNWDSSKDEALWKILSGVAKTDIDWEGLAGRFDVSVDFLLQQVTYLTERHASQVRAQMRKATAAKGSLNPSPTPGPPGELTSEAMRRTGSGGGRAPSSLSVRRDTALPRLDGSTPGTPGVSSRPGLPRPQTSRTASSSNTTVLQQQQRLAGTASPRNDPRSSGRPTSPQRKRLSSLPIPTSPRDESLPSSPGPAESTSSDGEDSSSSEEAQSRIIRRPPRRTPVPDADKTPWDDESEEAEPAFLPFKAQAESGSTSSGKSGRTGRDLSATLRGDPRALGRRLANVSTNTNKGDDSSTGESSAPTPSAATRGGRIPSGPLSPRRTAELAGRSPAGKGKGYSREGSDGTPSMGSSFSDLDDASVTQSALEEALLSNMKDGMGSRISNFSQAIKSRYLPTKGPNTP